MSKNFLEGFVSLTQEQQNIDVPLEVKGALPSWLSGSLIRNGPGLFFLETYSFRHVFDGMAMLYKFAFENGEVRYTNRFLMSKAYRKAVRDGELAYREFATEPHTTFLENLVFMLNPHFSDNTAINVTKIDGKHVALNEALTPVEFDPHTLKTIGDFNFQDSFSGTTTTAHPLYDYHHKALINLSTHFSLISSYKIFALKDGSRRRVEIANIKTRTPAYMHSFAMTKNFVILIEAPWTFSDFINLIIKYKQPFLNDFDWNPGQPTKFTAIDKRTGKVYKTWETATFMPFHTANAYEIGNEIIVDLCAYKDNTLVKKLYFASFLQADGGTLPEVQLRRYHLKAKASDSYGEVLADEQLDMPRYSYRRYSTKNYQYLYGIGPAKRPHDDFINQIVKVNLKTHETCTWRHPGCYPGEPIFVARPDGVDEDDGVVLSLVQDSTRNHSFLLILDGQTFYEKGRVQLPHVIPFGFHGMFYDKL